MGFKAYLITSVVLITGFCQLVLSTDNVLTPAAQNFVSEARKTIGQLKPYLSRYPIKNYVYDNVSASGWEEDLAWDYKYEGNETTIEIKQHALNIYNTEFEQIWFHVELGEWPHLGEYEGVYPGDYSCHTDRELLTLGYIKAMIIFLYRHNTDIYSLVSIKSKSHYDNDWDSKEHVFKQAGNIYNALDNNIDLILKEHQSSINLMVNELINYYEKITKTPEWQSKFKSLSPKSQRPNLVNHSAFPKIGFPEPDNFCFKFSFRAKDNKTNKQISDDVSLDNWLYSFWYRRHIEGTMEITHNILNLLSNRVQP